jgi:hypothetical protein
MPDQDQIAQQQRLLEVYRQTLAHYLGQFAMLGSAYAPPAITHGIREAREEIRHVKAALRGWGVPIEDLPDDQARDPQVPTSISDQASAGITAMADLLVAPSIRTALEGFRESFVVLCQQIDRLSNYKDLHDLLHDILFNCYNPIVRGARDFPNNLLFIESLVEYADDLHQIANSLGEIVERAAFIQREQTWIRQVEQAVALLHGAVEQLNKALLDQATFQLDRVLYVHPTRINECLKEVARDLPLPSLITAMGLVQQHAARAVGAPEKENLVGQGITALEHLSQGLAQLIAEHDAWQEIDLELCRMEKNRELPLQELEWLWLDLRAKIVPLCADRGDRWTRDLLQAAEKLEQALETRQPIAITTAFRLFRRQVGLCFFQADKQLKELCRSLRRVDGPLQVVMSIMA